MSGQDQGDIGEDGDELGWIARMDGAIARRPVVASSPGLGMPPCHRGLPWAVRAVEPRKAEGLQRRIIWVFRVSIPEAFGTGP